MICVDLIEKSESQFERWAELFAKEVISGCSKSPETKNCNHSPEVCEVSNDPQCTEKVSGK